MAGGVDPTGLVKGWAAQRALGALTSGDLLGAIVNAAGDVTCFGGPAPATPFRIGIVDPLSPGRLACVVDLAGAIATSGTYERGQPPLRPADPSTTARVASASVCGPDLALADALATALAVAGVEGLTLIESTEDYEALTISFDGAKRWTTNFPFTRPGVVPPPPDTSSTGRGSISAAR